MNFTNLCAPGKKIVSDRMSFHEGQLILLCNPKRKKGLSLKLQTSWDGPYKIIKRLNDVMYRIQKANSPQTKIKIVHIERLTKYGKRDNKSIRISLTLKRISESYRNKDYEYERDRKRKHNESKHNETHCVHNTQILTKKYIEHLPNKPTKTAFGTDNAHI